MKVVPHKAKKCANSKTKYCCPVTTCPMTETGSRVHIANHFNKAHPDHRSWRDLYIDKNAPQFIANNDEQQPSSTSEIDQEQSVSMTSNTEPSWVQTNQSPLCSTMTTESAVTAKPVSPLQSLTQFVQQPPEVQAIQTYPKMTSSVNNSTISTTSVPVIPITMNQNLVTDKIIPNNPSSAALPKGAFPIMQMEPGQEPMALVPLSQLSMLTGNNKQNEIQTQSNNVKDTVQQSPTGGIYQLSNPNVVSQSQSENGSQQPKMYKIVQVMLPKKVMNQAIQIAQQQGQQCQLTPIQGTGAGPAPLTAVPFKMVPSENIPSETQNPTYQQPSIPQPLPMQFIQSPPVSSVPINSSPMTPYGIISNCTQPTLIPTGQLQPMYPQPFQTVQPLQQFQQQAQVVYQMYPTHQ